MTPEREQELIEKYPDLFRDKNAPPPESLMCFGCECGDGWFAIIDAACDLISRHVKGKPEYAGFRWVQIKEKYGTLRLYSSGGFDDYTAGVISMAERMSAMICERCGAPGTTRGSGWLHTSCDACCAPRNSST
jgi:hypothetical protein